MKDITLLALQSNLVGVLIGRDTSDAHWALERRPKDMYHPFGVSTLLGLMVLGLKILCRSVHSVQFCHFHDFSPDLETRT